jgi:hypothetical protein
MACLQPVLLLSMMKEASILNAVGELGASLALARTYPATSRASWPRPHCACALVGSDAPPGWCTAHPLRSIGCACAG